jgi:DHA1 family tetracycline resistance protein-like MFS transporter
MHTRLLIAVACLLGLFSTIGASLPYPILPPLFASGASNGLNTFLGLPPKLLFGLALTINPLGLLIGNALLGPLSDRYGRRPVLLITAVGAAVGHGVTALSLLAESYPLFIVARFVTGLLEGNGAVARAMLADRLEGDMRVSALSWLNSAFYIGWLAGPLLAGATLVFGLTVPFWIAAVALLVVAALVVVALPLDAPSSATSAWWQVARDQHAFNLLQHAAIRKLFIVQLAFTCGVTAFYEFYPLWLVEVAGYGATGIAWMTAVLCAVMTITAPFAGRPSTIAPLRRAAWNALAVGVAVAAVGFGNVWVGLVAIALFGVPNAIYNAVIPGWCAERFGYLGQGAVMGLLSTTFCLANILMALAGSVLTLFDTRLILWLGAALAVWAAWRLRAWRGELTAPAPMLEGAK